MNGLPLLTLLVFLPAIGTAIVLLLDRSARDAIRTLAGVVSAFTLVLAIGLIASFPNGTGGPALQFEERMAWVPAFGIEYHLGVDGINVLLVGLTALLGFLALVAPWSQAGDHTKEYAASLLALQAGVTGALVSLDLVLFFVFWEVMLVPMYLLVGMCGGPRRVYAALKFFIYTSVGSLLMLVGIIALYVLHGRATNVYTFDWATIKNWVSSPAGVSLDPQVQMWIFLTFALAFAIKVPVIPFHTWLPDVYTQAPLPSLVLATMLVKVGAYGFIRFGLMLFPQASAELAPTIALLAVIGILYGGLAAIGQRDLVGVFAYSSIAHLGFVVLGMFALNHQGVQGALLQMVNHGLSAGALFLIAAFLLARTGTTELSELGGLARRWPVLAAFFLVSMLSAVGLPGLNGFVGEVLILVGSYQTLPTLTVIGTLGIILSAVYLFNAYRKAMHGPTPESLQASASHTGARDLRWREALVMVPLVVLFVWIGLFPTTFLSKMEASVAATISQAQAARAERTATSVAER